MIKCGEEKEQLCRKKKPLQEKRLLKDNTIGRIIMTIQHNDDSDRVNDPFRE